jgi:hypothetical protein
MFAPSYASVAVILLLLFTGPVFILDIELKAGMFLHVNNKLFLSNIVYLTRVLFLLVFLTCLTFTYI